LSIVSDTASAFMQEIKRPAEHQRLTPVILVTQEARDQEDGGLRPAWANSSQDPILKKNPSQKKG
jgi:hypothetical protein